MIHPVFQNVLARDRDAFNARFAEARERWPGLDAGEYLEHLRGPVDRLVSAAAGGGLPNLDALVHALCDVSLDLFALRLLGPRAVSPLPARAWETALPRLLPHLAAAPRQVLAAVFNGALAVAEHGRPALERWTAALAGVSPLARNPGELLAAGQVLAWTVGLAHYRPSALAVCRTLPPPLQAAVLGTPGVDEAGVRRALEGLCISRWYDPRRPGPAESLALRVMARTGAFRGFGGPFARPPWVAADGRRLLATDGETVREIHADHFGCTLTRADDPVPPRPSGTAVAAHLQPGGRVRFRGLEACVPELSGAGTAAADGETLAVALERSHVVWLLAAVPA
ncbi:MAG: hypothetical protein KA419_09315 [Acidobacteria bacterium]|nr:hypothetical protein [Acidobacteriota bacterium]